MTNKMIEIERYCRGCDSENIKFTNDRDNGPLLYCIDCSSRYHLPVLEDFKLVEKGDLSQKHTKIKYGFYCSIKGASFSNEEIQDGKCPWCCEKIE